jgi:pyruvate,water dikinase
VPDIREDAEDLLCSGSEGVLSADMGRGIWSLAQEAKQHKPVRELLEKYRPDRVLEKLRAEPGAKEFVEQLDRFLAKHGHRALKEFELQSVRWEENSAPVLGMARNYMLVDSDPSRHEEKVNQTRARLEMEIRKELEKYPLERTLRLRWRFIRHIKERARYFTKQRENSRFYHIMAFYMVRKKILKVEADLMRQGKLKCKGDIFFLERQELAQLRAGRFDWLDVEERIRDRRVEHIRLSKMVPPKTIGVKIKEKPQIDKTTTEDACVLRGQSASPGNCEGIAHVIIDPSIDIELKPGEILIAPYTDPAWTPLFLTAGAAVVEVGSYLSHAGTVAREFGMPCVVDVSDCTRRIHSGVRVKVDGDHGVVRLEEDDGGKDS